MKLDLRCSIASLDAPLKAILGGFPVKKIHLLERSLESQQRCACLHRKESTYVSRGWTEWTQGFQYGAALLSWMPREIRNSGKIAEKIPSKNGLPTWLTGAPLINGFNKCEHLWQFAQIDSGGKKFKASNGKKEFLNSHFKVCGAVQATRWRRYRGGYIYSFQWATFHFLSIRCALVRA